MHAKAKEKQKQQSQRCIRLARVIYWSRMTFIVLSNKIGMQCSFCMPLVQMEHYT